MSRSTNRLTNGLSHSIIIQAPADAVWDVVGRQFAHIGTWATVIPASTAYDEVPSTAGAPVAGRVCHTNVGFAPEVTERIVTYDDTARTLTYEAIAGTPAFVRLARNRWQVTALDAERTTVTFNAQLEVRGLLGRLARWWLLVWAGRTGRYLLHDLKHYVEHGTPSTRKQRAVSTARSRANRPTPSRLSAALRANAVFSTACGVALAIAGVLGLAGMVAARSWGLGPAAVPLTVGLGLAGFGLLLVWLAVQPLRRLRPGAVVVVIADALWVAGSIALLGLHAMPWQVTVLVAAQAAAVAGLATWQATGLATIRHDDPLVDVEVIEASRVLPDVSPSQVWPLLTDHDLYGRLAPNLSKVEVISDPGQPLRRRCTNTAGQAWEETCTLWEEGRRFAVEVDVTHYPYPLQLMQGLWQVDPDGAGSRVTMRFTYRATPSITGGLLALALRALFPPALTRIFTGWQTHLAGKPSKV